MIDYIWSFDLDILLLIFGYAMYRWGKKNGVAEGKRESYREERLWRMEERFDELCDEQKKSKS